MVINTNTSYHETFVSHLELVFKCVHLNVKDPVDSEVYIIHSFSYSSICPPVTIRRHNDDC